MTNPTPSINNPELLRIRDQASKIWQESEQIETEVFLESGYIQDASDMVAEYGRYRPESNFITVRDKNVVLGAVRVILSNTSVGLKTVNDIRAGRLETNDAGSQLLDEYPSSKIALDVGTLAVDKSYRGVRIPLSDMVSSMLFSGILDLADQLDSTTTAPNTSVARRPVVTASFDEEYALFIRSIVGNGIHLLGPATADYMGSPTVPALIDCLQVREDDLKKPQDERLFEWIGKLTTL